MSYPTPQPPDKTHLSHVVTPRLDPGDRTRPGPESAKARKVWSGCLAEVEVSFQHFVIFAQYLSLLSYNFFS